jgi:uncharacterized protein YjbI with pentapeptide repeats
MVPGYLDLAEVEAEYGLFERVRFDHTPFSSAKLRGVRMVDAELDTCDTSNADFAGSRLNRVVFSNCRMTGVTLAGASLRRHCDFSGARMRAVDLRGSEIALSGRASDLAGAIVSPMQLGELAGSLAEGAGIRVE